MVEQSDIFQFMRPGVAVDVVALSIIDNVLHVGLIRRDEEPYKGKFALPGRFVRYDEPIEETARMALATKGNIDAKKLYLEQLYTFGNNLDRDTRIRAISITYYCLIEQEALFKQSASTLVWKPAYDLPPLGWDHKEIIEFALSRIRLKLFHSDVAFKLTPQEFTLTELQRNFEALLNDTRDKRNFRKKIPEVWVLKDLKKNRMEGAHRPAAVYSYVKMVE